MQSRTLNASAIFLNYLFVVCALLLLKRQRQRGRRFAWGPTQNAYLFGAVFLREEVRKQQTDNLEKLLRRLESETASSLSQVAQSSGAAADASVIQSKLAAAAANLD